MSDLARLSKNKLIKKIENMRNAYNKNEIEKTFWQRLSKYYAPNRFEEHCKELDKILIDEGIHIDRE